MHLLLVHNTHTSWQWWTSKKEQVRTGHDRTAHEHCNHQCEFLFLALYQYSIELVCFLQTRTWPNLWSYFTSFYKIPCSTNRKKETNRAKQNIIWSKREQKMHLIASKHFRRKQFFFAVSSRVYASVYECQPKNQIKFNKRGKHISHNWA